MSLNDAEETYTPRSRYSGGLRASDAEREATATVLRRNYTAGRLDQSEYEERVNRCYAAKWVGELADLTLDLPQDTSPEPHLTAPPLNDAAQPGDAPYQNDPRHWWPVPLVPILIAVVILGALSHGHAFWLFFPLAFFLFRPWGRRYRGDWNRRRGDGSRYL